MFSWIWGEKKPVTPTIAKSINESFETVDGLIAKRLQLLHKAHNCLNEAKEHKKNGQTGRAMSCMKQKQQYEQQSSVYEGMIANMEKTSMALESTATSVQVAKTMKEGTMQMKDLLKEVNIDDIDKIADDLDDSMRDVSDMSNALSRPLGVTDPEEDEMILKQMEEWDLKDEVYLPDLPPKKDAVANH